MKKRILSVILAVTMLFALAVPAAAASVSSFTDITDEAVMKNVETLRTLGVVDGVGNNKFNPSGNLTRAQFCKMAVIMMGKSEQEPAYRNRTIFADVKSTHWARGYINLAATGDDAIISGIGNGEFSPDTNITYSQAITILVRLLGYKDSDTNMQWPDGYMSLASKLGLTSGINLANSSSLTRAQAAQLFCSLLRATKKDDSLYISQFGTATTGVILLNNNATAADGTTGALFTSAGTYKTDSAISTDLIGERGTIVVGTNSKVKLFLPDSDSNCKNITVTTVEASWVKDSDGTRYSLSSTTPAYTATESKTWTDIWLSVPSGSSLTLYFASNGSIESVFYASSLSNDNVMVAKDEVKGNPFTSLLNGATNYTIYKNGASASVSDIRRYDVATYDTAARRLNITDLKLTGCYENASPSESSPEKITLMGHTFTTLPSAQADLSSFKIGDSMTLLLTADCRVAAVVPVSAVRGNAVGIVSSWSSSKATVKLLSISGITLELSGKPDNSTSLISELVSVASYSKGSLSLLSLRSGDGATGKLDLKAGTLGTAAVSPAVTVFDRAGKSAPVSVKYSSLGQGVIPADSILYARLDYAGRVDMLVLDDATGDCYTYGYFVHNTTKENDESGVIITNTLAVKNSDGTSTAVRSGIVVNNNTPGGIAYSADGTAITSYVKLSQISDVPRTLFTTSGNDTTLTINGVTYPVADDVQCYNSAADQWFSSLAEARAFSSTLTVYYDRSPDNGGKIRLIEA